ncbi:MAG TPA: BPSS1780 family membrane protein [Burkholderiaceae bacterium]|nr:BPSS1780 family membrane protein [Burkholderiaceae bacterium]
MSNISIRQVPASHGVQWIKRGLAIMMAQPLAVHGAFFFYLLSTLLLQQVPVLGGLLPALIAPALVAGVMTVIRAAATQSTPSAGQLIIGFRDPGARTQLLMGGVLYLVGFFVAMAASALGDGGMLFGGAILGKPIDASPENINTLTLAQFIALAALMPTVFAFWFAPQFMVWHGMGFAKACFFSFFGCLRNFAAIIIMFGSFLVILLIGALVASLFAMIFGSQGVATVLMVPIGLFCLVLVFCTFHASYEDVVVIAPEQPAPEHQPGDATP